MKGNVIETRIKKSLVRLGLLNLDVTVDSLGIAELTGSAETWDDRALIAAVARTTPGVAGVKNQIRVVV